MPPVALSIVIITHTRAEHLQRCLESISRAILSAPYELIIVANGKNAAIDNVLKIFSERLALNVIHISPSTNGHARNCAIQKSRGEIIYFLDDDVLVKPGIFTLALNKFSIYPDVDIIGGANEIPEQSSFLQKCIGATLACFFATGVMHRRYVPRNHDMPADEKSLILSNLAFRRNIFEKPGVLFPTHVYSNEENILLQILQKKGSRMILSEALSVYHAPRKTVVSFFKQVRKYGRGRGQNIRLLPKTFSVIYLIPSIACLYCISVIFYNNSLYRIPFYLYMLLDLLSSIRASINAKNALMLIPLLFLFPLCHSAYGIGVIETLIFNKKPLGPGYE